jgi:hypothetical protein
MSKLINIVGTEFNFTFEDCKKCLLMYWDDYREENVCCLESKEIDYHIRANLDGFPSDCPLPDIHIGKTCTPEYTWVDKFFENPLI